MTSNHKNWTVLISTMLLIGLPVLAFVQNDPGNEERLRLMLRATAFTSFLVYLLVFVTRPLRQLVESPVTRTMLRNRRYFGIVLAGSHTVHLFVIIWVFAFVQKSAPPIAVLALGGSAYVLLYSMLITSFDRPAQAIGPVAWRRLHKTGLYWNGGIFAVSLVPKLFTQPGKPLYLVSTVIIVAAVGIRLLAFFRGRRQSN